MPAYQLVSLENNRHGTIIKIGSTAVGGGSTLIIAGPCAVENRKMVLKLAPILKNMGVGALRGGAFKPRTSPYSFQGLGKEGLIILKEAGCAVGLINF